MFYFVLLLLHICKMLLKSCYICLVKIIIFILYIAYKNSF
nr:MAG TPA: hypothetical protein [Caudoviricetes sp.]